MKNILLTLLLIIPFTVVISQETNNNQETIEIIIDGLATEWSQPLDYTDKESGLSWSAISDKNNLYICIQSLDQSLQQKFIRAGMTISFTSKGKSKVKASVNFPQKSGTIIPSARPTDGEGRADRGQMRQEFINSSKEMKVKGLASASGTVPNINMDGISAAFNWEAQFLMSYEMKIPLKEIYGESFDPTLLANPLEVKIIVHGVPQPQSSGGGSQGAMSGGGGGRGGRGGGGMPPSGGSSQGAGNSTMSIPTIVKGEINLSIGR
jgi:uncharacterized membrane protein YgcG